MTLTSDMLPKPHYWLGGQGLASQRIKKEKEAYKSQLRLTIIARGVAYREKLCKRGYENMSRIEMRERRSRRRRVRSRKGIVVGERNEITRKWKQK